MGTQPKPPPKISFGPFEYDPVSGEFDKHGRRVRLQGQPLQILSMLVARPGELLTREELQRALWGGAAMADAEHGLNAAVNKLRQTLGDSADQPRYIETVPGRGYRFIAPVQSNVRGLVVELAAPGNRIADTSAAAKFGRSVLLAGALVTVTVTALAAYWFGAKRNTSPAVRAVTFELLPPEGFELEAASSRQAFALSPDGATLAFTAIDGSGLLHLFLRDVKSLESQQVVETSGAHTLFWGDSPDSLYFTRRGELRRLDLNSGKHAGVAEAPGFLMHGARFGPQRLLLFASGRSFRVNEAAGDFEMDDRVFPWAQVLPGGSNMIYTQLASVDPHHSVYAASIGADTQPLRLTESDSRAVYAGSTGKPGKGYLLFVRGGTLVVQPFDARSLQLEGAVTPIAERVYSFFPTAAADFSVSGNGLLAFQKYASRSQLVWVDRSGRTAAPVSADKINVKSGRLSPDGRTIAASIYSVENGAQNIWLIEQPSGSARLLTAERGLRDSPVWSPDSKRVAFLWGGGGQPPNLKVRGLGVEDKEIALQTGSFQLPTDWSPDGRFIVFVNTGFPRVASETQSDVWLADLKADNKLIPLLKSGFHEANPAFSPDGKWLAFTSNESGGPEMYIQRFEGGDSPRVAGPRIRVTKSGAQALRWRRDGRELFYLAFDGTVHAVPVQLRGNPVVGEDTALFAINLAARAAIHSILGFDVSPDGQRFLIPITTSPERASIVVKQHWEPDLR